MINVENRQFLKGNCDFLSYLSEMKTVSMFYNSSYSTFYSFFLPFFVVEIFKFKYGKFFVRHSASISKFE